MMPSASCDGDSSTNGQESHVAPTLNCLGLRNALVPLVMLLALCGARAYGVTWKKRDIAYHCNCLYLRKIMIPFMMLLVSCDTDNEPSGIMWQQHQWHHMMPIPVAIVSWDQKKVISNVDCLDLSNSDIENPGHHVMPTPLLRAWHDQKSHVAPQFDHLDTRDVIVLLTMPSASCDVPWPKKFQCTSYWSSWCKECSCAINSAVYIIWCWCQC